MDIIDIIIPIFNGHEYLDPLFNTIYQNTAALHRLIIVNDCSSDPRIQLFLNNITKYQNSCCQDIIVYDNEYNLGFVKTVNLAFKDVRHNFVILNTDIELPQEWLQRLMDPINNDPTIASVTPLTNAGTICSFPNWLQDNPLAFSLSLKEIDDVFKEMNITPPIECPTGVGFCMAINYQVAKNIGLFDEISFGRGYGEENDWCMRAKNKGYRNVITTNLFVYHKHGGSFGSEKITLMKKHSEILSKKHPDYTKQVNKFITSSPLMEIFAEASLRLFLKFDPAVIFHHKLSGGSTSFIEKHLLKSISSDYVIMIEGIGNNTKNNINLIYRHKVILGLTLNDLPKLLNILAINGNLNYHINHLIHINHLADNLPKITDFFIKYHIKPILYLHDYFTICPSLNLLNKNGKYCAIPDNLQTCNKCLQSLKKQWLLPMQISNNFTMEYWRMHMLKLLQQCQLIYTFSESSNMLLEKAYPNLKNRSEIYKITAPVLPKVIYSTDYSIKEEITIGILGSLGQPKGIAIVEEISAIIRKLQLQFKLILIGTAGSKIKHLECTGKYHLENLPTLCLQKKIDLFILPSICPETYCYAADEIIHMGFPIFCFNIGAPAERVIKYQLGRIVQKIDSWDMLKAIDLFVKQHGFTPLNTDINLQNISKKPYKLSIQNHIWKTLVWNHSKHITQLKRQKHKLANHLRFYKHLIAQFKNYCISYLRRIR